MSKHDPVKYREYYERNRERILARKAAEPREVVRARNQKYYAENRAAEMARAKAYRDANPEKCAEMYRDYAKRRPEVYRRAANKRRALKAQVGGTWTLDEWEARCAEYGHRCAWCREAKPLHADHVVPLSKGVANVIDNLQPLCKSCNSRKATQVVFFPPPLAMAA